MSVDTRDLGPTLFAVRRMFEGVVPPTLATASADGVPHVSYLSLAEYVDPQHVALSFQFFNHTRDNVLATGRASLALDDPYNGAGVVMQLAYVRTDTTGPIFERIRAKLDGIASHVGMEKVFHLRGADIYKVLELRRVPGRKELPAARPRCDVPAAARALSERMAACDDLEALLDTTMDGLGQHLLIDHAMLWMLDRQRCHLTLVASRGYPSSGVGADIPVGEGLAGIAVREGVPIRVGHMLGMQRYGLAVRGRATELGLDPLLHARIPLPGLADPRSQLAVPLRARGRVLGVLFVESTHNQYFSYDDEDALMLLGGQLASALTLMQSDLDVATPGPAPGAGAIGAAGVAPPTGEAPPLRVRHYAQDDSVFLDDSYLIKGVAGAILWRLVNEHTRTGRTEFTNRELRLAGSALGLPDLQDNLEVRLILLQRRLAEREAAIQIAKTGRGRFRLDVARPLALDADAT